MSRLVRIDSRVVNLDHVVHAFLFNGRTWVDEEGEDGPPGKSYYSKPSVTLTMTSTVAEAPPFADTGSYIPVSESMEFYGDAAMKLARLMGFSLVADETKEEVEVG